MLLLDAVAVVGGGRGWSHIGACCSWIVCKWNGTHAPHVCLFCRSGDICVCGGMGGGGHPLLGGGDATWPEPGEEVPGLQLPGLQMPGVVVQ